MALLEPKKVIKEDVVSDICYSERMKSKEMIDQDIYVYNDPVAYRLLKSLNAYNSLAQFCF